MTHTYALCGAVRSAFLALPPLPRERSTCVLPEGHGGNHRDLAGGTWIVTPEVADAVAVSMAAAVLRDVLGMGEEGRGVNPTTTTASEPEFRSPRCVIGIHDRCRDAEPRDSGVPGVRHLVCVCPCHRPVATLAKGGGE